MAVDKSELKRIIAVMKSGKIPTDQGSPNSRRQATSLKRRAAAAMVDLVLEKAALTGRSLASWSPRIRAHSARISRRSGLSRRRICERRLPRFGVP